MQINTNIMFKRCEASTYTYYRFNELHYLDRDGSYSVASSAACFLFYYENDVAGFCSIINRPYNGCPESMGFNRVVVLEKFRGKGIGGYMVSLLAAIYTSKGNKVYMMTENEKFNNFFLRNQADWSPTKTNNSYRTYNNDEGNKFENRKDGIHYHYQYIGIGAAGYEEYILPISKMRENSKDDLFLNKKEMTEQINEKRKPCKTIKDTMVQGRNLPDKKQLFNEFWFENEICVLFSEQGKGKTILAVQIVAEIAKNEMVLYLDYEMGDKQLYNRYSESGVEFEFNDNFLHPDNINFRDSSKIISYIRRMSTTYGIKTIIIDNISALSYQLESASAMIKLMSELNKLKKELGLSILLLGHTIKRNKKNPITDNDLSGSKKIIALVDSAFAINSAINDDKQLYLKQIKCRECEMKYGSDNVMMCIIEKFDSFIQFVPNGFSKEEELLDKNKGRLTKEEMIEMIVQQHAYDLSNRVIAKNLNISEGTVRNYLSRIKNDELVAKIAKPFIDKLNNGSNSVARMDA